MTALFGLNQVLCVTVNVDTYFSSVKIDDYVWLCGNVVHQYFYVLDSVGDRRSFLGADSVERDYHGGINGARNKE